MAFKSFNAKPTSLTSTSNSLPFPLLILNYILRFSQLVLALTVCGLYGTDLNAARKVHAYADGKWVYAVVVASLSAVTAVIYMVPRVKSYMAFGWDVILFILWTAVFGIFGKLYIHANAQGDGGITRMKRAVWIDLVNMLLWLVTAGMSTVMFFLRGRQTLFTGRARA